MEQIDQNQRNYRFHFMKDHFWMWAVLVPFGIICWVLPFVILWGLGRTSNSPAWFPYFGFIFLGIPCYLIGWIFIYSLMEGIYTRVTFCQDQITIRLPWLVFPLVPVKKSLDLYQVQKVDMFARYGTRIAVFLYYIQEGKERRFYLPRFQHDPDYQEELRILQNRFGFLK
ncbi:MAG: hypothetical protein AB9891_13685 [Anaerolineaceae bacterium]